MVQKSDFRTVGFSARYVTSKLQCWLARAMKKSCCSFRVLGKVGNPARHSSRPSVPPQCSQP